MDPISLISASNKIAVFLSPIDGDCVGSALATMLILKKMGKTVDVYSSFSDISYLSFLAHVSHIKIVDLFSVNLSKYDLGIFLDGSPLNRFYDRRLHDQDPKLPESLKTLVIDHHPDQSFSPNTLKDLRASSTCELIYKLFQNEVKFDKDIATYLYLGVSTDTGRFKYPNTTPEALEVAADLLRKGVDIADMTLKIEQTEPLKTILYRAQLIPLIKINTKLRYASLVVCAKDHPKLSLEDLETVITNVRDDEMRSIDGVGFVLNLTEREPGYIYGSLRGRISGMFDTTVIAKAFGGGGHPESSGFSVKDKSLAEAEKLVDDFIHDHYNEIKIS